MTHKKKKIEPSAETSPATKQDSPTDQLLATILSRVPETQYIPLDLIDYDPENRPYFKEKGLAELAANIKATGGVWQDILIQPRPDGRFKMIAGERRHRASVIAGLSDIPSKVCPVTDSQARRLRFAENAFRQDLHPMEEARLISEMLQDYGSPENVAAQIGKAKGYVYSRMRLNDLVEPIQEMFLAGKFTIQESLNIAVLSSESQVAFFDEYCQDWKEDETFRLYDLPDILEQYQYRLEYAPFDIADPALVGNTVACTVCPHNSAVALSLFPDEEPDAVCNNRECYDRKCGADFTLRLTAAYLDVKPQAIVFLGQPSRVLEARLEVIPDVLQLPRFNYYHIERCPELVKPEITDFPRFWEGQSEPGTDDEAYAAALQAYEVKVATYDEDVREGRILIGLYVRERELMPITFYTEAKSAVAAIPEESDTLPAVTNKALQAAIKQGSATVEMVDGHEDTCKRRETRNQELDREKIFTNIHELFKQLMKTGKDTTPFGQADVAAGRFLIYSLLYGDHQNTILKRLFPRKKPSEVKHNAIYQKFITMDEDLLAWMVRMAMLRYESGANPKTLASEFLYQAAAGAGVDVAAIEKGQASVAKKRQKNLKKKLSGLKSLRNRLAA